MQIIRIMFLLSMLVLLTNFSALAQEPYTQNTFKLAADKKSPSATIADMAWLAGHWTGNAMGGFSEEIWSTPKGGAMMGMYRFVNKDKIVFYELMTIVEENGSLILRIKHFNPNLKGWEEKDKTNDFPLVSKSEGAMHFEGMTFKREGDKALTIFLVTKQKDGSVSEEKFHHFLNSPTK